MTDIAALTARLAQLEAKEAIAAVMAEYAFKVDHHLPADEIAELFTEDAVWEARGNLAEFGVTRGRSAIRDLFASLPESLSFTAHYLTNPHITVNADATAGRGRWHTFELSTTTTGEGEQICMVAWYDNDFVKVDDAWKISHIRFEDIAVFPFSEGWLRTRYISPITLARTPHP